MTSEPRRVAVVTGAARGLGRAYSSALARAGFNVTAADVNDPIDTVADLTALGARALGVVCDVSVESDVANLAERVKAEFGGCDVLVNNAAEFSRAGLDDTTPAVWERVLRVNLDGMLYTCRQFVPGMREKGWGRVINVSSTTTELVMEGWLAYITTKSGIIGFTRALASDVGPFGVTVNAVMPGLTRTDATLEDAAAGLLSFEDMAGMQPVRRVVETTDLADVVTFLASDASRMMTGQTLVVDGGIVRH